MKAEQQVRTWVRCCLINLAVVAFLGILLRYKIAWCFPALNYKYLLNAHSHFAFNAWVTTAMFTAFVYVLVNTGVPMRKIYRYQFWLNQLSSYGMLACFIWQGYGPASIFFSALSVVFSYCFAYRYWRDLSRSALPALVKCCMRLALTFLVISSAGPYLLAYSMSQQLGQMQFYYDAIYLYLHFQYNGWFTFGVLALFFFAAGRSGFVLPAKGSKWFVGLMAGACVPAYTLSLLWTQPAVWIWITAGVAGLTQWIALGLLAFLLSRYNREMSLPISRTVKILWTCSFCAFAIKTSLQALSVIPLLGHLAFGYRPVIIAYLHLVMLCFVSFFVVGFLIQEGLLRHQRPGEKFGLWIWITGAIGNEVLLLIQSLLALTGHAWSDSPYYLFGAAVTMLLGLLYLVSSNLKN